MLSHPLQIFLFSLDHLKFLICFFLDSFIDFSTKKKHNPPALSSIADVTMFYRLFVYFISFFLLAPQSGALRISAYRDFQSQSQPIHPSTYSFRAFKPFYGDLRQRKQTKADQCRPSQTNYQF